MIKQIAIAVAAATTLFAAAPAMASTPRYWSFAGHDGTAVDNGSGRYDYLTLSGAAGRTQIKVLCTGNGGNEWSAWALQTRDSTRRPPTSGAPPTDSQTVLILAS